MIYWISKTLSLFFRLQLCSPSHHLSFCHCCRKSQEHELSYGFWFDFFQSFVALVFFFTFFFRLCYFSIFMFFLFLWGEKKGTFFVLQCLLLLLTSDSERCQMQHIFFSFPPSLTLTTLPTYISTVLNSQLACSRYLSLPPHKWPWHSTVYSWALSSSSPLLSSSRPL